jgi:hypothetical protein
MAARLATLCTDYVCTSLASFVNMLCVADHIHVQYSNSMQSIDN